MKIVNCRLMYCSMDTFQNMKHIMKLLKNSVHRLPLPKRCVFSTLLPREEYAVKLLSFKNCFAQNGSFYPLSSRNTL